MKPRSTFAKDNLHQIYPDPVPWVGEVFDPRIETLLESPDLTNMDRMMLRLRSAHSRTDGDARYLLKFLRMLLPELFDEKLMAEIAKETWRSRRGPGFPFGKERRSILRLPDDRQPGLWYRLSA
jgi:hypothetical protein